MTSKILIDRELVERALGVLAYNTLGPLADELRAALEAAPASEQPLVHLTGAAVEGGKGDALDAARYRALKQRHGYLMVVRLLGHDGYRSHMKDAQIDAYADLAIKEVALRGDAQPDALELLSRLADYFDSFREDGLRPDEWLLKEWSDKARAVLSPVAPLSEDQQPNGKEAK